MAAKIQRHPRGHRERPAARPPGIHAQGTALHLDAAVRRIWSQWML
jgi:hypothetical protein